MVGESCSCEWLSEKLLLTSTAGDDGGGVLLLDCRTVDEYRTSHVRGSINVPAIPSIMMRRLKNGSVPVASVIGSDGKNKFTDRWKSDFVVLYDGGPPPRGAGGGGGQDLQGSTPRVPSSDVSSPSVTNDVVSLLMGRLQTDGCQVRHLQGGFNDFHHKYSHLCVGTGDGSCSTRAGEDADLHGLGLRLADIRLTQIAQEEIVVDPCKLDRGGGGQTPSSAFPFPVQVMPYLFLGNADNSSNLSCMNKHGIRYVLNVTSDIPNTFADDESFRYLRIPITDNLSQDLTAFFSTAIAFIDEARNKKCGVLVHCLAGISRSVTITVAYLMFAMSLSLDDAYDYLRQYKPNISPNFNFMGQLLDFQVTLQRRLQCSCSVDAAGENGSTESEEIAVIVCSACRNTKTYFSGDQTTSTAPVVAASAAAASPTSSKPTSSPASSTASSSTMSISSLTSSDLAENGTPS